MKLNLIVENKTFEEDILAEHGLSLLIETENGTILFDSGQTDAMIHNSRVMGIDLLTVDYAVLSHGHYDHSGGFPAFGQLNPTAPLYIHQNAFKETYEQDKNGKPTGKHIGIRWSKHDKESLSQQLKYTSGAEYITDNIILSGSIPEEMREEGAEFFLEKAGYSYEVDKMEHEQFLIIRENGMLYVFTGCSHNGVKPIIDYTKELFPDDKIKLLFGGFHFYSAPYDVLINSVERLCSLDVEYFMPVHCTGLNAIIRMKELLGDRCIILNAGDKLFF